MARILIVEHDGPARRIEVSDDPEDGTGMWDCETCGDGEMRPNLTEALHSAIVHVDHQCTGGNRS